MTFDVWAKFMIAFGVLTMLSLIGEGSLYGTTTATDINSVLGFQVDEVATGGGFTAIPRAIIGFFTTLLPKVVTWDYQFLDDLQIVRWFLMLTLSAPLMIGVLQGFLGSVQSVFRR